MRLVFLIPLALTLLAACTDSPGDGGSEPSSGGSGSEPGFQISSGGSGSAPGGQTSARGFQIEVAFPALTFTRPVAALQAPGDASTWYVVEQAGRVWRFANAASTATRTLVADFTARVESRPNEAGLLGMAFHPEFAANRKVFLSYTAPVPVDLISSRISRFAWDDVTDTLDIASEEVLLEVSQPFYNHNGGQVSFGPDGYLYVGLGDGGSGGDPDGNGQNTGTLLGAILRIDVDGVTPPFAYAIPPDNPFALGGGRPELYAWGLRNPWRWSFDTATGELWAADVGQAEREEVDLVVKGGNYGWNVKEGTACFGQPTCDDTGLIDPVTEYTHADGCSITGGYVYRGSAIAWLVGRYLYADYCSGTIWAFTRSQGDGADHGFSVASGLQISSFAQDADGEVLVLDHRGGQIYRLVPTILLAKTRITFFGDLMAWLTEKEL